MVLLNFINSSSDTFFFRLFLYSYQQIACRKNWSYSI